MKLAILIVGEYRSFSHCRKTMLFLDQSEIDKDIYISTWNQTNTINSKKWENSKSVNVDPIYREVTLDEIYNDINIPIKGVAVNIPKKTKISPIVNGWILGFNLVKNSSIHYDYVLVLRPDLFFENNNLVNSYFKSYRPFENYKMSFGVNFSHKKNYLDDTIFFSSFDNIEKILDNQNLTEYLNLKYYGTSMHLNNEWHEFWYDYIVNKNQLSLRPLPMDTQNVIYRYPLIENPDFKTLKIKYWNYWNNLLK